MKVTEIDIVLILVAVFGIFIGGIAGLFAYYYYRRPVLQKFREEIEEARRQTAAFMQSREEMFTRLVSLSEDLTREKTAHDNSKSRQAEQETAFTQYREETSTRLADLHENAAKRLDQDMRKLQDLNTKLSEEKVLAGHITSERDSLLEANTALQTQLGKVSGDIEKARLALEERKVNLAEYALTEDRLSSENAALLQEISDIKESNENLLKEQNVLSNSLSAMREQTQGLDRALDAQGEDQARQEKLFREFIGNTFSENRNTLVELSKTLVPYSTFIKEVLDNISKTAFIGRIDGHGQDPKLQDREQEKQPKRLVWDEMLVDRFWNGVEHTRLTELNFSRTAGEHIVQILREFVLPKSHILDFGGGDGTLTADLIKAGYACAILEPSRTRQSAHATRLKGTKNFLGSVTFDDQTQYDTVVMTEVVEHILDHQLSETLNHIAKVLKPGGNLFITCPNQEDLELGMVFCPQSEILFHRWQHVHSFSPASLTELVKSFDFYPSWIGTVNFSNLEQLSHWLANGFPATIGKKNNNNQLNVEMAGATNIVAVYKYEPVTANKTRKRTKKLSNKSKKTDAGNTGVELKLTMPFDRLDGLCFKTDCTNLRFLGDNETYPNLSPLELLENGVAIGQPHSLHKEIIELGMGRYSHWEENLYFSTTDGSDPNSNGKSYSIRIANLPGGKDFRVTG